MKGRGRSSEIAHKQGTSDAALVMALTARDEEALSALYDRYSRKVYSLIVRIVGKPSVAEEVLQDVFLSLWQHASSYNEQRGPLLAWLLVIARSRAVDRIRARPGRNTKKSHVQGPFMNLNGLICESGKEEEILAVEKAEIIQKALQSLPALQRSAIELAYFEGLSQSEIAERLEEPLGTVKTRIRLGLMKLKEALAPHFRKEEPAGGSQKPAGHKFLIGPL